MAVVIQRGTTATGPPTRITTQQEEGDMTDITDREGFKYSEGFARGARWASLAPADELGLIKAFHPTYDEMERSVIINSEEYPILAEALSDLGLIPTGGQYQMVAANPIVHGFMLGAAQESGIEEWTVVEPGPSHDEDI